MKHLDERVSDLVDDRLDHDERDRALVHLTLCTSCREAVELERHARNALRALPDLAPPAALVQRLLALAEPGEPLPPVTSSATPPPVAHWRPRDSRPGGSPSSSTRPAAGRRSVRRARGVRAAAVGMCASGAMLILFATLGGAPSASQPPRTPVSVVPPLDQFTVEHARSTGGLPFVEPASLLVTNDSSAGDGW